MQSYKFSLMRKRIVFQAIIILGIYTHVTGTLHGKKEITLESIYKSGIFSQNSINGIRPAEDGEHYTMQSVNSILKYSYETGEKVATVFSLDSVKNAPFSYFYEYELSTDEKKILFTTHVVPIYRYSFAAEYFIYNIEQKSFTSLFAEERQQLATFSPDGSKVAFIYANNLYYKDLQTNEIVQVTYDGQVNKIINGIPDWVYEEEFSFSKAFEWSPDSKRIAFYRFDESRVKEFNMTLYEGLYPGWYRYKYPKAGEENSLVTIHVYELETGNTQVMDIGTETDQYIPRIRWTKNPETLCITRLNRRQDHLDLLLANSTSGKTEILYSEKNKYYISRVGDDQVTFLRDGKHFLLISEKDGYMHLYLYDLKGKPVSRVTKGNYDIEKLLGIDEEKQLIYYTSSESSPLQRDLYSITFDGLQKKKLSEKPGTHDAQFSRSFKYYINRYSNANTPAVISVNRETGEQIRVIEDNHVLQKNIHEYQFSKKEFIKIPAERGLELNAFMIKPPDFDSSGKYPVFMYVYGGPESQTVLDSWSGRNAWFQLLAQQGYIVVSVDGRGTDFRGEKFRKSTYMQLGKHETEDQISAAQYLATLPYVDDLRIGIFGWSYGGYMTLLCLMKGSPIFKMGIAVAPVSNWRFYDTIYTERYMRKPEENREGYDENSPINHIDGLQGNLLLIHGMADDNVHFQNSAELIKKLIEAGKQFDLQVYPDKNHSLPGVSTQYHLYTKMTNYILENL